MKAIAAIIGAFGWREVVPIYEDTDYGEDMIPYLTDAVQDVDARVPYRSVFSSSFTDDQIRGELYKLMTMQTRVFVVHMTPSLSLRLFSVAKEIGMMRKGYVWIITDGLTDFLNSMDAGVIDSMQGAIGIKPYIPRSDKLDNFTSRWRRKFIQDNPDIDVTELSGIGLWAYDSVWALATAVEKVRTVSPLFKQQTVGNYSTDIEALGISQIGPNLLASLLQTKFSGLSGEFWLKNGQLQSSAFQIVNVIGKGGREIGFWSPDLGISQILDVPSRKTYSTSKGDLRAIVWPGESTEVPKGWELPISEKKLKIGVPMKDGFSEFVKVHKDPHTNATVVTGFCIDVFKAVIDSMPYAIPYEFVPFAREDGQTAGDYNALVDQVYFQIYDAVVGDVTILGNRSQHVDFTLPYTESGVSMVVPLKDDQRKNAWIFLKPLTTELWLTSGAFFIFTGFVVWALEHRVNKDFRGKPGEQVGMIFWFSFSTLVFAHKERVTSNLARFVLLIWIFVVLILTSSYTASLTSMLTVQQIQPTVRDFNDLKKNGDFIGYQRGSFVTELMEVMGIDPSKFRPYDTLEECHEALSKGSSKGGVSAIFDEIPYIKLFLGKYCTKYMMVGPAHRTAGFGFVFPKGSALVPDISRAILNVTEGEKMDVIERTWFGHQDFCPEQGGSTITSERLTVTSFKGLFLIAGVSSIVALIMFFFKFLHEHKRILVSERSISRKLSAMAIEFDKEKDTSSRGSKDTDASNGREAMGRASRAVGFDTSCPQSPETSITMHQEDMVFSREEGVPYSEPNTPNHDPPAVIEITSSN